MDNCRRRFLKNTSFVLTSFLYGCSDSRNLPNQTADTLQPDSESLPTRLIYPYLYMPLNEGAGVSVLNRGSFNSTLNVSTINETQTWEKSDWFTTNSSQPSIIYTDDLQTSSIFNVLNNVSNGIGGQVLLLSFWAECKNTRGTLISYGSTNNLSSGWQIMQTENHLKIHINNFGSHHNSKILVSGAFPVSGEHHIAILIDFKNADCATWINGLKTHPNVAHREELFFEANDPLANNSIGLTLFSRNIAIESGDRIPEYPWSGSMKDFLAVNLSESINPWSHIEHVVDGLSKVSAGSLNACLGEA